MFNGYVRLLIAKISYFSCILPKLCTKMTFKSGLACSDTINVTMHCFKTIHKQLYYKFVLLDVYDTDKMVLHLT